MPTPPKKPGAESPPRSAAPAAGAAAVLSPAIAAVLRGTPLGTAGLTNTTLGVLAGGGVVTTGRAGGFGLSQPDADRLAALEAEIRALRQRLAAQAMEASRAQESEEALAEARATIEKLQEKEGLAFLLDRVGDRARSALLGGENLRNEFLDGHSKPMFVVSVDIRRSTELMLKARSPEDFAAFITELCNRLMDIVRQYNGVVDKFTGDGILAFFPDFFTGEDAGYATVAVAQECHRAFARHYRDSRRRFTTILAEIGLGIGVDYGACHLVRVAGTLTVVGAPVVYACRLGGGPPGVTLLNQPAYERVSERHGKRLLVRETTIDIKHEGALVAYDVRVNTDDHTIKAPAWIAAGDGNAGQAQAGK